MLAFPGSLFFPGSIVATRDDPLGSQLFLRFVVDLCLGLLLAFAAFTNSKPDVLGNVTKCSLLT